MVMGAIDAVQIPHGQAREFYRVLALGEMRDYARMSSLADLIQKRLDTLGISARGASLAAGLDADAIRNVMRGRSLDMRSERLAAIARILQCDVRYLRGETDEVGQPAEAPSTFSLPVRFTVAAGDFKEVDDTEQTVRRSAAATHFPKYDRAEQWLEEVDGTSINKFAPPGSLIHVVSARDIRYRPRNGDLVVVLRTRAGGHLTERSVKQIEVSTDGVLLWPRSYDPRWAKPLDLRTGASPDEDLTVEIVGKVVAAYNSFDDPTTDVD